MKISDLIPTHNILRNPETILYLTEVVKTGCAGKVMLVRFEDNLVYVHDGHHRLCAMILAGHKVLRPQEYNIEEMCYIEYWMSNPRNNWFTPFDPRTQCRIPDFSEHKASAEKIWKRGANSIDFHVWLRTMEKNYAEYRFVNTMGELLSCTLSTISNGMDLTNYKTFIL